jgi:hypothetical protein
MVAVIEVQKQTADARRFGSYREAVALASENWATRTRVPLGSASRIECFAERNMVDVSAVAGEP